VAVRKRKLKTAGKVTWFYCFDAPGSSRGNRKQIVVHGFPTKKAAQDAEAQRRIEVQREYAESLREAPAPPMALSALIDEYCREHAERNLAPKTVERYRQMASYLAPELLATPISDVTSRLLTREWNRLRETGGHHRHTKAPRPLSSKTVRNIAGVVSSAFVRGVKWGLATFNPVPNSDLPAIRRKEGLAFSIDQQSLLLRAAEAHWALPITLELSAATGARRGEILALRWSDVVDGRIIISRSLSQTKAGLFFKRPKNEKARVVTLPTSAVEILHEHRAKQEVFRRQFGPDYKSDLDLVIANPDGTPLRPDSISAAASALCRRLKLPKGTSLHTLRHTHGSHLLAAGLELPAVSARLGHSNPYVTATVYSHVLPGRDDEAAKMWEKFQNRAQNSKTKSEPT
jgi:integrase